ncbi:MAG: heavy-metal-associated domain-containing protein [Oscillospiraceae bacterium]|nr:heavy-metal-associated domain-containing protein [Oscillospiraceae bacterium]MBO5917682.1 heavy-metal-associated domain-containing protein [Oscillospiraceae bacterium]
MKKTFDMTDLECAHCAAKMENAIRALDGVTGASINFFAQKLTLEAEDARFDDIVAQAQKICRKVEPDCRIVVR